MLTPSASSSRQIAAWPMQQAAQKGVTPSCSFGVFSPENDLAASSPTASTLPMQQAWKSGVRERDSRRPWHSASRKEAFDCLTSASCSISKDVI